MDTAALRRDFDRDGYAILPDALSPDDCDRYKRACARTRAAFRHQESTVYVGLSVKDPDFHALVEHPRLLAGLDALMDDGVAFLSDKLVFKSKDKTFPTPWHVDRSYWEGTRPKLSIWLALDEVRAEDGALSVVRGSHRSRLPTLQNDMSRTNGEFNNIVEPGAWPREEERVCAIARGTAIYFSDLLIHGSMPCTSGRDRWAWIGTYHAPAEDEPFDLDFPARRTLVPRRGVAAGS